jgi:hypothetical protein
MAILSLFFMVCDLYILRINLTLLKIKDKFCELVGVVLHDTTAPSQIPTS